MLRIRNEWPCRIGDEGGIHRFEHGGNMIFQGLLRHVNAVSDRGRALVVLRRYVAVRIGVLRQKGSVSTGRNVLARFAYDITRQPVRETYSPFTPLRQLKRF